MTSPTVLFDHTTSKVTFIDNSMPPGGFVMWRYRPPLTRWQRWRLRAAMATGRLKRWLDPR